MSDLLERLRALRGDPKNPKERGSDPGSEADLRPSEVPGGELGSQSQDHSTTSPDPGPESAPTATASRAPAHATPATAAGNHLAGGRGAHALERPAAQLGATLIHGDTGIHLVRMVRHGPGARHGSEPLGGGRLHPLLVRQAGGNLSPARSTGPVLYIDTETTGLAGGTGTFAFLIGVGVHDENGFGVRQFFLPGPEHERSQLEAFASLAAGASTVVTYNGASFDIPLLRNRFAINGMADPLEGVPHLDLLTLARRLWRSSLPDCTLSTVEQRILGARRSLNDVPGFEVPARYLEFLRSRDASGLRGVLEHNESDIVALTALRSRVERLIEAPADERVQEAYGLATWLERLGEQELALARYMQATRMRREAAWPASLLLKRMGRLEDAVNLWFLLGRQGMAAAWVELAKVQEHRWRDFRSALDSVDAAAQCRGCDAFDLEKRRARLLRRIER